MAERDPSVPQVNDPELETELIRVLSIIGPVGKLNLLDLVIPTVSLGSVVQQTVAIRQPAFRSTDIFSAGLQTGAAINTVLADTGALPAGVYDVQFHLNGVETNTRVNYQFQHRNAANAANLMAFQMVQPFNAARDHGIYRMEFGYEIAVNERLRVLNLVAMTATEQVSAFIFARRRI